MACATRPCVSRVTLVTPLLRVTGASPDHECFIQHHPRSGRRLKMASSSSLSSVVSNLVRAQLGTSLSSEVPDDDLDKHVADLILREAKQKEEKYLGKEGVRAYYPEE